MRRRLILIRRIYEMRDFPGPLVEAGAPEDEGRAWEARLRRTITECDPHTRGIVMLGLDAPEEELRRGRASRLRPAFQLVKGFAVGRTIFLVEVARDWLAGRIGDKAAVPAMTEPGISVFAPSGTLRGCGRIHARKRFP